MQIVDASCIMCSDGLEESAVHLVSNGKESMRANILNINLPGFKGISVPRRFKFFSCLAHSIHGVIRFEWIAAMSSSFLVQLIFHVFFKLGRYAL